MGNQGHATDPTFKISIELSSGINTTVLYLIYKITNTVNGKIYVGAHVTWDINDGYMGSGHALNRAKKKYGIEHFIKEILHIFDNEQDMWVEELNIVNEEFCKRTDTYNIRTGGVGGWNHWNGSEQHKEAARVGGKIARRKLIEFMANQKANHTEHYRNWLNKVQTSNKTNPRNGWKHATPKEREEHKKKISEKATGEGNSQFGKYWISNTLTKEVRRIGKDEPIPDGWVRGKLGHRVSTCWINNGIDEHVIQISQLAEHLDNGFIRGRLKTSMPQKL